MATITGPNGEILTVRISGDNWVGTITEKDGHTAIADRVTIEFKTSKGVTGSDETGDGRTDFDADSSNMVYDLVAGETCTVTVTYGGSSWSEPFVQ